MKRMLSSLLLAAMLFALTLPASASEDGALTLSRWAEEEVARAGDYELLPGSPLVTTYEGLSGERVTDWRQPITRAQFVRFALSYAAVMSSCDEGTFQGLVRDLLAEKTEDGYFLKMPFTDDSTEAVALAYTLGLVDGRAEGIFEPDALITRQEAATLLYRSYLAAGGSPGEDSEAAPFADEAEISDWAQEAVHALRYRDVLRGMEDGGFAPQGNFTVEQCAVCFLRLFELMPVSPLKGNAAPLFGREETIRSLVGSKTEVLRLEGPLATLLVTDFAAMHSTRFYYLVYPEGGARHVQLAVSVWFQDFYPEELAFSEDGATLSYTITLERTLSHLDSETDLYVLDYAPGIYRAEMDVLTGAETVTRTEFPPDRSRWTDVPADSWYYDDAVYCQELGLMAAGIEFSPEETVTEDWCVETLAHVYSYLVGDGGGLPLLPENWGEAVITDGEGRTLASFRAWEKTAWRTWTGPMNKDLWHYSITAMEEEVLAVFPDLEDGGVDRCPATLDMGDKQVSGTLSGSLQGEFEDGRPAFLFYPAETSGYKDAGIFEPGAPTTRFLAARPGSYRGRYYFAEKGISFLSDGDESQVQAWELVSFLYRLSLTDELPEWVYAPVRDTAIPEGTPFRDYVTLLVRTGILPWGSPDWEFDAYAPVTRAQFAAVLHRLLEADAR